MRAFVGLEKIKPLSVSNNNDDMIIMGTNY